MAIDCHIYNPVDGNLISNERFFSIPFLYESNINYGKRCVVHQDKYLYHIDKWTLDENSDLWNSIMCISPLMQDSTDLCEFYSKEEIVKMDGNKTIKDSLIDMMNNYNIDGIIVQIW